MDTKLVSLVGTEDIPLNRPLLVIGRSADCDVMIDSKKISRQHCCIASLQHQLLVRDLGSTNGIRINGRRHDECRLVDGDELTIGNMRYRVTSGQYKPDESAEKKPVSDSVLDEADEPVALEEIEDEGMGTELASDEQDYQAMAERARQQNRDSSFLQIPEDVNLSPASDSDLSHHD